MRRITLVLALSQLLSISCNHHHKNLSSKQDSISYYVRNNDTAFYGVYEEWVAHLMEVTKSDTPGIRLICATTIDVIKNTFERDTTSISNYNLICQIRYRIDGRERDTILVINSARKYQEITTNCMDDQHPALIPE